MKKSFLLIAVAALTLGLASCSDEMTDNGARHSAITSAKTIEAVSFAGTNWAYNVQHSFIVPSFDWEEGLVEDTLNLSATFLLNFNEDGSQAVITLPEETYILQANDSLYAEEANTLTFDVDYEAGTMVAHVTDWSDGSSIPITFTIDYNAENNTIEVELPWLFEEGEDMEPLFHMTFEEVVAEEEE